MKVHKSFERKKPKVIPSKKLSVNVAENIPCLALQSVKMNERINKRDEKGMINFKYLNLSFVLKPFQQ